jgi:dipeptidyl aminopeptidase/acylaminoacyl peptidase
MDRNGGSKKLWVGSLMSSPQIEAWAPDGAGIYYSVEEKGTSYLYFAPVAGGTPRKVTDGVQMLAGLSFSDSGQVAGVRSSFKQPGSLVTFNLKSPGVVKQLVDVNQDVMEGRQLGDAEEIWYTSKDGLKIQGWLIKPANYEPGKKYPMVLWIHGGPWSMYSIAFSWAFQNFAANGYAVLYTNPRGSTDTDRSL